MTDPRPASGLTAAQHARAVAALEVWFTNPGGGDYHVPGARNWDPPEIQQMHAALEAPDTDAALAAFPGGPPGTIEPQIDAENRLLMLGLRNQLRDRPGGDRP